MWCFDVDARFELASRCTTPSARHATLRVPGEGRGRADGFEFETLDGRDGSANLRDLSLAFGDGGKGGREMKVSEVRAIYGKFVREGKLTIEGKDGTKVLVRGAPEECARVMRTLTTLKSQPLDAKRAFLKSLERCAKCAGKCEANERREAERQEKAKEREAQAAERAAEAAAASAEKKRKREAEEAERRAVKDDKLEEQLRTLEEKKSKVESTKAEIASLKTEIEGERDSLLREKEDIMRRRRELEDERRLLERQLNEVAAEREKLETERNLREMEARTLGDLQDQNARRKAEIDSEIAEVRELTRTLTIERERLARVQAMHKTEHERTNRVVEEEIDRRAQQPRPSAFMNPTSPSTFYGKKKPKTKIVMDDDDSDSEADKENDETADAQAEEEARRKERIERLRQAELERQLKEKLAREELARTQAAAQRKKDALKREHAEAKAERERRQRIEEEARTHHRAKAQHEAAVYDSVRSISVPTATRAMFDSHLQALENLKTRAEGAVGMVDIPWPPAHNIAFFTPADEVSEKKRKVMKATLNWHPDKFEAKFGKLLKASEADKIRARVAELSAQFIHLRQVLNG